MVERAAAAAITRSAAAVDLWQDHLDGAVVAMGNAPTALFRLLELLDEGAPPPALVLAFPLGFVGAAEAKEALMPTGLACRTSRCAAAAAAAHWRRRRSTLWREVVVTAGPEPWLNVIGIGDAGLASLSSTARAIVESGEIWWAANGISHGAAAHRRARALALSARCDAR